MLVEANKLLLAGNSEKGRGLAMDWRQPMELVMRLESSLMETWSWVMRSDMILIILILESNK